MSIYIQVYDTDNAFRIWYINTPVKVEPDTQYLENTTEKIISGDPFFSTNVILNKGSYSESIQEIQSLASLLNVKSSSDKYGLVLQRNSSSNLILTRIYFSTKIF